MNVKNLIRFIVAVFSLVIISIFLHEFIHVIQLYCFYGIPLENIEIRFFWEADISNRSLINFPAAWISYTGCAPTRPISHLWKPLRILFNTHSYS